MSLSAAVIDAMIAAGCTAEQLGAAVKADLAEQEARKVSKRANNAERQQRFRDRRASRKNNADNALRDVTPPNDIYSNPPTSSDDEAVARGKSAKPDKFPCPDGVDPLDWDALKANRKTKRAALTEGAHRQIVRKLGEWKDAGWPPGPIVAFAAERGWTSVFETDEMKCGKENQVAPSQSGASFALHVLRQAEQRKAAQADH